MNRQTDFLQSDDTLAMKTCNMVGTKTILLIAIFLVLGWFGSTTWCCSILVTSWGVTCQWRISSSARLPNWPHGESGKKDQLVPYGLHALVSQHLTSNSAPSSCIISKLPVVRPPVSFDIIDQFHRQFLLLPGSWPVFLFRVDTMRDCHQYNVLTDHAMG